MRTTEDVLQEANTQFLNKCIELKKYVDEAQEAIREAKTALDEYNWELKKRGARL